MSENSTNSVDLKDVRRWALAEGLNVGARGRIKKDIVDRYLASREWASAPAETPAPSDQWGVDPDAQSLTQPGPNLND